ncbi:MAG: hypothetical protein U5K00_23865 [Melioribacteraceae bacterium]|nr:hypothetical protein [Melioribacteraceae bacterium]
MFSELDNPFNHYLYDDHKKYMNFVFGGIDIHDKFEHGPEADSFRSIECQIMDWADDTAYAINDIQDSITGGFITIAKLAGYGKNNSLNDIENKYLEELIEWIKESKYKPKLGSQVGDFIQACSIKERKTFMDDKTNRYKYELVIDAENLGKATFYKNLAVDLVFKSTQLHQMESKGDYMLSNFFDVMKKNYIDEVTGIKLIPEFSHNIIVNTKNKLDRTRLICDNLAGMTDSFAMRSYRRLFDPNYSSLADLV